MFALALSIGIFSYLIFFLGVIGILFEPIVVGVTFLYWAIFVFLQKNQLKIFIHSSRQTLKKLKSKTNMFSLVLVCLVIVQILINFTAHLCNMGKFFI